MRERKIVLPSLDGYGLFYESATEKGMPPPLIRDWLGDESVWLIVFPSDFCPEDKGRIMAPFPEATVGRFDSVARAVISDH